MLDVKMGNAQGHGMKRKALHVKMASKECVVVNVRFDCSLSEIEKQCARGMRPEGI